VPSKGLSSYEFWSLLLLGFGALVALAGVIATVIIFLRGVKAVKSAIEDYNKRKRAATFNFYEAFITFLRRLEFHAFVRGTETPKSALCQVLLEKPQAEESCTEPECAPLRLVAADFLRFLSSAYEQIPACDDSDDFETELTKWRMNRDLLIETLELIVYPVARMGRCEFEKEKAGLYTAIKYFNEKLASAQLREYISSVRLDSS